MTSDLRTAQLVNIVSTDGTRIGLWQTSSGPHVPGLVLVGSETEARRRAMATALTHVLHDSRVTELTGQRHAAHQTAPEQFASAIRDFLGAGADALGDGGYRSTSRRGGLS